MAHARWQTGQELLIPPCSIKLTDHSKTLRHSQARMNIAQPLPMPVQLAESFQFIGQLAAALNRPVYIIDVESTGFGKHSAIGLVEYASIFIPPSGVATAFSTLINPEVPIQWGASKVHGIHAKDVRKAPTFPRLAPSLRRGLVSTLVSGFNSRVYDVKVINGNAERYDLEPIEAPRQLDVRDIWTGLHGQKGKLDEAASTYRVTPGPAHRAHGDVLTTARLLEAILTEHGLGVVDKYL